MFKAWFFKAYYFAARYWQPAPTPPSGSVFDWITRVRRRRGRGGGGWWKGLVTATASGDWILATGFWNDSGIWIDGDVWID